MRVHSTIDLDANLEKNGDYKSSNAHQGDDENGRYSGDVIMADIGVADVGYANDCKKDEYLTSITSAFLMRTFRISGKGKKRDWYRETANQLGC